MKGPFLFSRSLDLAAFVAPTVLAFTVILLARAFGIAHGPLPEWAWLVFVLGVDVAHVWATLFRTYLDPEELRRRPLLYVALPLGCWALGVSLYARSPLWFWRGLAYLAVFHFLRQQIGWAAIYRARAGTTKLLDRVVDEATLYLSMLVPLLIWHTSLPRSFHWFIEDDFVGQNRLRPLVPYATALLVLSLAMFAIHHLRQALAGQPVPLGKIAVVTTTAVSWWAGIVVFDDDLAFTVLNVLPHGVPYMVLLFCYARARSKVAPKILASRIVLLGIFPFLALLFALAFGEELLWDRTAFHDHDWIFGRIPLSAPTSWLMFLVPLLAVPQATHYALDAFLWRRRDARREQAEALGFRTDYQPAPPVVVLPAYEASPSDKTL